MDDLIVSFMEFTGCTAPEDAAHHLHSCDWNLDHAVNLFFATGAGPSGTCQSSPLSPDAVVRAPIPARSETLYGRADDDDARRRPGSRWDSETRVSGNCSSRRRNVNSRRRRRERFREEVESSRQRRRVDRDDAETRMEMEVDGDHTSRLRIYDEILSNNSSGMAKARAKEEEEKDLEELFRPPDELTFKGGFHEAKAHAARQARWLLVNMQNTGDFASFTQNRDVWKSEVVVQYLRYHFVLWQVDADAKGSEAEEARKVSCYYKVALDKLPVVVVVDPVTGQAMATLHGTSRDPNDFLMAVRPYVTSKPVLPARATEMPSTASPASHHEPVNQQEPATTTDAPTTRTCQQRMETGQEEQAPPPAEKQDNKAVVGAVVEPAPVPTTAIPDPAPAPLAGKVCKLRVRLPGGRVVTKEFGSGRAVSALFAYCLSELVEAGAPKKPFRLMRLVGSTREEIADPSVSFEDSGLHLSTVSVLLD